LDLEELRSLTMNDRRLMKEILRALIEDASLHAGVLEAAARERDGARSAKVARAAWRACANIGATAAADSFREIERHVGRRDSPAGDRLLATVRAEIERLRVEAGGL